MPRKQTWYMCPTCNWSAESGVKWARLLEHWSFPSECPMSPQRQCVWNPAWRPIQHEREYKTKLEVEGGNTVPAAGGSLQGETCSSAFFVDTASCTAKPRRHGKFGLLTKQAVDSIDDYIRDWFFNWNSEVCTPNYTPKNLQGELEKKFRIDHAGFVMHFGMKLDDYLVELQWKKIHNLAKKHGARQSSEVRDDNDSGNDKSRILIPEFCVKEVMRLSEVAAPVISSNEQPSVGHENAARDFQQGRVFPMKVPSLYGEHSSDSQLHGAHCRRKIKHSDRDDTKSASLRNWLLALDQGGGSMLQYEDAILLEFDGELIQVAAAFRENSATQNKVEAVDVSFWDAIGVKRLGHKLLFAQGMAKLEKSILWD